jgi:hypothetical protein
MKPAHQSTQDLAMDFFMGPPYIDPFCQASSHIAVHSFRVLRVQSPKLDFLVKLGETSIMLRCVLEKLPNHMIKPEKPINQKPHLFGGVLK